ncbi:NLRP1 [Symbiodinium pilosum]|uniref:NLRP1 protein n=1 Tax=Symbiodinium pilosum TaxID=2952 RepID=A0A812IVG7_SYMPI|nr:NLRP1 [Symbiodinium pilosum]
MQLGKRARIAALSYERLCRLTELRLEDLNLQPANLEHIAGAVIIPDISTNASAEAEEELEELELDLFADGVVEDLQVQLLVQSQFRH